jgi:cardiolipin synthase
MRRAALARARAAVTATAATSASTRAATLSTLDALPATLRVANRRALEPPASSPRVSRIDGRGFAASAPTPTPTRSSASDSRMTRSDATSTRETSTRVGAVESKRARMRGERNVNVPNALCVGRIVAGPALAYGIAVGASPELVLAGVTSAAVTDYLDGFLARRWRQGTVLGSYLDPIADKVFVGFVGTALAMEGSLPAWLVALLVSRDAIHVAGGAWRRAGALGWRWRTTGEFLGFDDSDAEKPPPTGAAALAGFNFDEVEQLGSKRGALRPLFIGKVNTALQMALITFAVSEPVFAAETWSATTSFAAPLCELVADKTVRATLEAATALSAMVATGEYARIFFSHPGFDAEGRLKTPRRRRDGDDNA